MWWMYVVCVVWVTKCSLINLIFSKRVNNKKTWKQKFYPTSSRKYKCFWMIFEKNQQNSWKLRYSVGFGGIQVPLRLLELVDFCLIWAFFRVPRNIYKILSFIRVIWNFNKNEQQKSFKMTENIEKIQLFY